MYSIVNVCSVNCVYSDHTVRKGEERLNGEEKAEGETIQLETRIIESHITDIDIQLLAYNI